MEKREVEVTAERDELLRRLRALEASKNGNDGDKAELALLRSRLLASLASLSCAPGVTGSGKGFGSRAKTLLPSCAPAPRARARCAVCVWWRRVPVGDGEECAYAG